MTVDKKKRARHVASDEAHAWARSLALNNPNAKTVLRALALYVNGEGSCFVGIDQLSDDTDLSADTVRRRLVWLEQIGAIVRLPQWLDENGRRNPDGRGKRTTDEIRLLLAADVDEIERRARGSLEPNSSTETNEISPSTEQGLEEGSESVSPQLAPRQPSQSCDHLISEPEPEDSPQPPSGGSLELEGWKEFEDDWGRDNPILRQSIAQRVWSSLRPEERDLARQAARGYAVHLKQQKRPPNRLGAHLFLKERDAWAKFAALAPDASTVPNGGLFAFNSAEAKAIRALYQAGGGILFETKAGISYRNEITPRLMAFLDLPAKDRWIFVTAFQQLASWRDFFRDHIIGARRDVTETRDGKSGMLVPWPWPPGKDGKLYTSATGPPETYLTEEDMEHF